MARQMFGGSVADWVISQGEGNSVTLTPGAALTFYNDPVSGTEITDLSADQDGATALDGVTASDGTDGYAAGSVPVFYGPDEVYELWVSANGGPRAKMPSSGLGESLSSVKQTADTTANQLDAHVQAANPHGTRFEDLADVSPTPAINGQVYAFDATTATWVPTDMTAGTGGGGDFSATGGNVITIPNGDYVTQAFKILIPAGDRTTGKAPNTFSLLYNRGTDAAPDYHETSRFNEYGELRIQPSKNNRIAARVKQFDNTQVGNLFEFTDFGNNVLSYVGPNGNFRAPNIGMVFPFSIGGVVAATTGQSRLYNDTGTQLIIRAVRASVGTTGAPTGSPLIVDVLKNGTSIFTAANRPTIPDGGNTSGKVIAINTTILNDGEYLTVDVVQVGSTTPGSDLDVQILCY